MSTVETSRWSDYDLLSILDENSTWIVYGRQRRILCFTVSLRDGLERSTDFDQSRVIVEELSRQPSDNIIVSSEQLAKLKKLLAGLEVPATLRWHCHVNRAWQSGLRPVRLAA
jgi:hypothetical protein